MLFFLVKSNEEAEEEDESSLSDCVSLVHFFIVPICALHVAVGW